ncbi:helix-turn-helix domain-containing protein [Flavilitoribacter nigricans]|uniref:DNA-binding protein n=1 Tax=Flavilitoribacter nigricans (strain ATCC 23147 / DSM 23189 / NBRC 102662 / NCIMB 1420 / SS-2) TaxID=1122177 RepID=A0A2D0N9P6_FLAN2|nr:helix-turn-helix domain-containing protein [Flavilitoribacter nigricans]PHN05096.1 DNA-binding protein [Flavilitoribacter nigricans DSM 23189 = NBRC 102662]
MADFATNVPIICLESETFKALVKELAREIREDDHDPFVDEKEAMRLLRITSKTTFQKYRDSGDIDYRIVTGKKYLYRRRSVIDFIENSPKTKE